MSRKERAVPPVAGVAIKAMASRLKEETQSDYFVADSLTFDWCPCCGVNIRLYKDGELRAKFIAKPDDARSIAANLLKVASRAREVESAPNVHAQAQNDLLRLCREMSS